MTESPFRLELSPLNFLRRAADALGERTAVVHGERRYTYTGLDERCNRLASALRARGLRKHDRVAVLCPNTPALLEAHYGVPLAGGVLVAMNTRLNSDEIGYILKDSGARLLLVDAELERLVADADTGDVETVVVQDTGEPDDPYEELLAGGSPEPPDSWLEDENEPISINYTSGTTGRSKGAVYSHRGAYLRAHGVALETRLGYDSVHLWTLPMFHCNGWCLTWGVTAVAGTHVCLRKVDPGRIWTLFEEEGVTHYSGAPTIHISIANHASAHRLEQHVTVPTGGSPPTPTILSQMRDLNLHPIHLYGLTETYGPVMGCSWQPQWDELPLEEQARVLSRQGHTYNGADLVRVVDEDMNDVPRDGETVGEVVMRGNSVMLRYHNKEEETDEAFRGGWFHSGDLAVWHPDGYVDLRDRAKDIIISGGENISSIEVEQTLARHPAVLEAAVVAMPDEKWGERPKAFVELKGGADVSEEDIIGFCREHLARYKAPARVEFGELPRTSTGKVQKFVLREREWAGREKAIG
ncbi:MAG TPA: acyl--CoA ligase family protein [Solirubrobacteraceae bacterium]|nr:acyl--CoA ligase family protein [Solirubrobacteraceae bacterium]